MNKLKSIILAGAAGALLIVPSYMSYNHNGERESLVREQLIWEYNQLYSSDEKTGRILEKNNEFLTQKGREEWGREQIETFVNGKVPKEDSYWMNSKKRLERIAADGRGTREDIERHARSSGPK